jgi:hypothetical protein
LLTRTRRVALPRRSTAWRMTPWPGCRCRSQRVLLV